MIKVLERLGIQGTYLNIIKVISRQYQIKWKETQSNSTKIMNKASLPTPYLFNIVLEILARAIGLLKGTKGIQIGKEEGKVLLFEDGMIVYIK